MAEEFECLYCPMCGSELIYSEGTHDLGCKNNPKPSDNTKTNNTRSLHEEASSYNTPYNNNVCNEELISEDKIVISKPSNVCHSQYSSSLCEPPSKKGHDKTFADTSNTNSCVFGISFTESAYNGTLWSVRIVDGETDYPALMSLMKNVEKRFRAKELLAANVPNLPKKIERSTASKLAFRYNLELEDLFSIKYSTETIERLAMFYDLTLKEVRHIKQSDILEE